MIAISTFHIYFHLNKGQYIKGFNGRIAHGAFLQYLRKHDILLSSDLHEGNQPRSFSLEPIKFMRQDQFTEGKLTVHTTDERITKTLIAMVIEDSFGEIFIVDQNCSVIKIEFNKHLIKNPQQLDEGTKIDLVFGPTYFSNDKRQTKTDPYPHLERIYADMVKTFAKFTGGVNEIDQQQIVQLMINQLATPYFSLRSTRISMSEHMKIICFKGKAKLLIENNKDLELLLPILDIASIWGVGGKRAMGFGRMKYFIHRNTKEDGKKGKVMIKLPAGEELDEKVSSN